jgi:REP element-mobilizing transposase RayT
MSNHTHVVVQIDKSMALSWTDDEVLARWHQLHKGTLLTKRYLASSDQSEFSNAEMQMIHKTTQVYRQRLFDLSWFMRSLNEYIARTANKEDDCTGRFWEGRFKSQALLDETALLACMAYVDLNPIRAKIASSLDNSKHTSIQRRLKQQDHKLSPFISHSVFANDSGIPFNREEYIRLVKETARRLVPVEPSKPSQATSYTLLNRLHIIPSQWLTLATEFERLYRYAIGAEHRVRSYLKLTT